MEGSDVRKKRRGGFESVGSCDRSVLHKPVSFLVKGRMDCVGRLGGRGAKRARRREKVKGWWGWRQS